ncbi:MAG: hypothetical protein M0T84_00215 [Betaproteobacteria bacterium]|nr:hypothetical protein [Betaproteobacteria bacterium]
MSPERLDWHLWNWMEWMHRAPAGMGYKVSALMAVSGSRDFDDMVDDCDQRCAEAVDAAISDLAHAEQAAIRHRWLGESWRFPRDNETILLKRGTDKLGEALDARGIY